MIGMFDSGVGGLTVLTALKRKFPSADVIYFGDIKNAPYGSRTHVELAALTAHSIQLLVERGARTLVSACNSVSASLALSMLEVMPETPERVIEMVGPTVRSLVDTPARLLLVATPATVRSGIYKNAFSMVGKEIVEISIEGLATAIEYGAPDAEVETLIRTACRGVMEGDHAVVLACTHYPLVYDVFSRVFKGRAIMDPAEAVAERVYKECWPREVGEGSLHFIISKDSDRFRTLVHERFPNTQASIEVIQ